MENVTSQETENTHYIKKIRNIMIVVIGVTWSLFQLWTATSVLLPAWSIRAIHLAFAFALIFMMFPLSKKRPQSLMGFILDIVFLVIGVASTLYIAFNYYDLNMNMGSYTQIETFLATLGILLVLEISRRTIGWSLTIIALVCLVYAYFGPYFPGIFGHGGYNIERLVTNLWYSLNGIFGFVLAVSATFVFLFVLFGAALNMLGGAQFINDFALVLLGKKRGGPAKISILASGFMGSISGSAIANVTTTGTFTIPLMKRTGFKPAFAGATEAVASSGGQFMPPVMGATGFLVAEILGLPYYQVALAAFIPGVLFYMALFFSVDFRAAKMGLRGLSKKEIPKMKDVLKEGWLFLLPIVVLIVLMFVFQLSPLYSAFWTILTLYLTVLIVKPKLTTLQNIFFSLVEGAKAMASISAATAVLGIVVGVILLTGVGSTLTQLILQIGEAGGLTALLVVSMFASIILGMGLPTTAAYILLSIFLIPAITEFGVVALAGHLFALYFGIISNITPPVAMASLVASKIADSKFMETGFTALRIGISGFLIPFMFVANPALLLQGTATEIIFAAITGLLGVYSLSSSLEGWLIRKSRIWERILMGAGSIMLIAPGYLIGGIGLGILMVVLVIQYLDSGKHQTLQGTF